MQKQKQFAEQEDDVDTLSLDSEKGFINEPVKEWPQWSVQAQNQLYSRQPMKYEVAQQPITQQKPQVFKKKMFHRGKMYREQKKAGKIKNQEKIVQEQYVPEQQQQFPQQQQYKGF